jgi:hypothetical protein
MNSQSQFGFENTETTDLVGAVGLNRLQCFEEAVRKYYFDSYRVFNTDKTGLN